MTDLNIGKPLTLPSGLTLRNRLVKAAMAENLSDRGWLPGEALKKVYGQWAKGGWGLVITGNVQVDSTYLGEGGDNAINHTQPQADLESRWKAWAAAAKGQGTAVVAQINHPGKQSPVVFGSRSWFTQNISPSAIPLQLGGNIIQQIITALVFGTPREIRESEIGQVVAQFAQAAKLAETSGFDGVEIHAAHGYLLAQFLSPQSNQRSDAYGGTAAKRARVVVEIVHAIRAATSSKFTVGIKVNSVDHQAQGELDGFIEQLRLIVDAGIDFVEISGGTYENPTMMMGKESGTTPVKSARTAAREAFFLDFAHAVRESFPHVPLLVTGGFRTRQGMEQALQDGGCDFIGLGPKVAVGDICILDNSPVRSGQREAAMAEQLIMRGELTGHSGWVTSLATSQENPNMLLSGSRDKTLIIWDLTRDESQYGIPKRSLHGHSHIVSDCVISSDGAYALSSSWDKTLRLWELSTGNTTRTFVGHTNDVLSVSFSADNRQIVSGSRDRTIKLWNTLGDCKYTITDKGHTDWVSCVRFSPNPQNPVIVSAGWDKLVKVWELASCRIQTDHIGHTGYINTVTISPDGSLCASGGKDGTTMLWDLNESKHLYSLQAGDEIHALVFSPNRYWLCAATSSAITIFDLEKKSKVDELKPEYVEKTKKGQEPYCVSLAWSADGQTLFSGYTDSKIRAWGVMSRA
ncbi:hypothetical protein DV737_g2399, partial [Chaetothyriales sp. CBS 132003]